MTITEIREEIAEADAAIADMIACGAPANALDLARQARAYFINLLAEKEA